MPIPLENKDLTNLQQMEVAVNGPDGATHLIICTGVANLGTADHETYTFLVGPHLSRRQFVGVIASGAWSWFQAWDDQPEDGHARAQLQAALLDIVGSYDEGSGRVRISADVSLGSKMSKLAFSYHVSILAELPIN